MSRFDLLVTQFLTEFVGGNVASAAFTSPNLPPAGSTASNVPSSGDGPGYPNSGDARYVGPDKILGSKRVRGKGKKGKTNKKAKDCMFPIQRRTFSVM